MFKLLVVLSASLCIVYAGLSASRLEPKPRRFQGQEGCYIRDLNEVIPFGQSRPSKTACMEYRCSEDYVNYVTCSVGSTGPPCWMVEDHWKPYPDCCPRVECP